MITLRMLAIAAAILLLVPIGFALADHAIGHVTVPGGEVVDTAGEFAATITDVALLSLPQDYDKLEVHNAPEQLVEGHTVFVTWDILLVPNVTNWTADVIGNVDCQHKVNTTGRYWNDIPVPQRVNEAHVECRWGETVIMTPDPFYDSQNSYSASPMAPTGTRIPFTAPNGVTGEAVEYEYLVVATDWLGVETVTKYYAWQVPIVESWMHADGRERNFYCPVPEARLLEMGVERFLLFHERDMPDGLRIAQ